MDILQNQSPSGTASCVTLADCNAEPPVTDVAGNPVLCLLPTLSCQAIILFTFSCFACCLGFTFTFTLRMDDEEADDDSVYVAEIHARLSFALSASGSCH